MSQICSRSRRAAATGALAALSALVVAPTAGAATGTVDLQCLGPEALRSQVTLGVEYLSETVVGRKANLLKITSVDPSPSITALAPKVTFFGRLFTSLERPGSTGTAIDVSQAFTYPVGPSGGVAFDFPERGDWLQTPKRATLSLRKFDENGVPIPWPYVPEEDSGGLADPYTATISCTVAAGDGPFKTTVTDIAEPIPPSVPGPLEFSGLTATSVRVSWAPSTVAELQLTGYEVSINGGAPQRTNGTTPSYDFSNLEPGTTYSVSVVAVDAAGQRSEPRTGTFTTNSVPASSSFSLAGNASLKTLVRGSFPLMGKLQFSGSSDAVTGTLDLAPSTARLTVLGAIPVTATISFVPTTGVTGTVSPSKVALETKARLKVTGAKLFGTIPLVSGTNCQTRQASTIKLGSTGFTAAGGTLAGTFAISDLTGCGAFTGLVSAATAGTGNVIALKATPLASTAS